ncbi:MAG: transcriptional regulator, LysR family [Pelosinus sp.]|jgi:DNA-binding transcriptional LysR family regulator|nr:transcriptional regulator, LysR family [Pelosinus sp.]
MNIDDIQAFLAVVSNQSLTKAAEMLHLSQSSVSHRLKNLEQELDLVLVQRGKGLKTIALTPAGEDFILVAEKWIQLLLETQSLKSRTRLSLSIGAVDSVNTYLLPNLYQQIICQHPTMRLHIYTQNSTDLYDLIEQRAIDIAFVLHERIIKNIEVSPFFAEPMVVIRLALPEHLAVPNIHPQQLNPQDELYHDWFPAYQIWHNKWWDPFQSSHIQVSNGPMVLPLLRTRKQWAIVPLSIAQSKATTNQYTIQKLIDPPPDRICYKLTHKFAKSRTKEAEAIFDTFAAELLEQIDYLTKYS